MRKNVTSCGFRVTEQKGEKTFWRSRGEGWWKVGMMKKEDDGILEHWIAGRNIEFSKGRLH